LHAFNKDIAKAEDVIAEMFCLTLQPQSAIHHCKESIQILEKLYHSDHIVIANKLVKLVSIELSVNNYSSINNSAGQVLPSLLASNQRQLQSRQQQHHQLSQRSVYQQQ